MGDWNSLMDPNVKIKASGIGSGNLHRKGANFKPVDEQMILNQRLGKGGPMPKSASSRGGKKKRGGFSAGTSRPTPKPFSSKYKPYTPAPPSNVPSTTRRPPPGSQNTAWGSGTLADTPFWEKAATPAAPAPPVAPAASAARPGYGQSSSTSRYAPQHAAPAAPAVPAPAFQQGAAASKYAPTFQQGAAASKYAPKTVSEPAAAPVFQEPAYHHPPPTSSPPPPAQASTSTSAYNPLFSQGAAASKYAPKPAAPPAPVAPVAPAPLEYAPEPVEEAPLFSFNIELAPGVYANLPVYPTADYLTLVDAFEKRHHLQINDDAKQAFASKIGELVEEQLRVRGLQ
ncbi:hypothetical protein J3Q64DRAFT_1770551 [Phycomyces blakesleeanus]|uniref:Uncharacterized protein n=1 Tax=Phycomyces blakesleeanus TaxID=4837 RepID=A0ABR3AN67_PHYBL